MLKIYKLRLGDTFDHAAQFGLRKYYIALRRKLGCLRRRLFN